MKSLLPAVGFVFVLVLLSTTIAQPANEEPKSVNIPLDQVWAFRMPGTRTMSASRRTSDGQYMSPEGPLLDEIRRSLKLPAKKSAAMPAFAVLGSGIDALREAHAILVNKNKPRASLPSNSEISIVFFSHQFGDYVHLHTIVRSEDVFKLSYDFVPHLTTEVTEHIAFVPIGKLKAGKFRVEIVQAPIQQESVPVIEGGRRLNHDVGRRIVCNSFSFSVR